MSQYFDMGDETLWNPSNGVARLFLLQVAVFETELGLPSGVGSVQRPKCAGHRRRLDCVRGCGSWTASWCDEGHQSLCGDYGFVELYFSGRPEAGTWVSTFPRTVPGLSCGKSAIIGREGGMCGVSDSV